MKKTTLNKIELTNLEDYSGIGNSRIGGQPDLPIEMDYPTTEDGFLEFIMQINLNDVEIEGLPNSGLLSLFNGNLDKREAKGFYFTESTYLTKKEIPINTKFAGVVDFHEHTSHKISIIKKEVISMDVELSSDEEYDSRLDSYHNCSVSIRASPYWRAAIFYRTFVKKKLCDTTRNK